MSYPFYSPSFRAAQGNLTIQMSPLGLVELADEEFEVHGPRLNRYATAWAFYLGHHWSYLREVGEPQLTFNYVRAFSDFITSFTFGEGVTFRARHKMYEAIQPRVLRTVWEEENPKETVLWEIGNHGSITGDAFVKVAWEDPYQDPTGRLHPGRVRIIPLNSSACFPEWHPHDREHLIRFKLKYRFWGTTAEGTRQVFTYTEIITENIIQEFVNDELIDQRPNSLGVIPIVHISNMPVSSSPWGLGDCHDMQVLNREFNEKATDISDIINYHAAPVTVITGAKAANLEKGPKKVWSGLPVDAKIFNLDMSMEGMQSFMAYLDLLKRAMHELTGVPESALGQFQPISNTSGVALAIMYLPMMNRFRTKTMTYGLGFQKINKIILLTLASHDPERLFWDPERDEPLEEGQTWFIDPDDPKAFETTIHWKSPLPMDTLLTLQELEQKLAMGIESNRGALRELGYEFPDEKMNEIFEEKMKDMAEQAALQLYSTMMGMQIAQTTGVTPTDANGNPTGPPVAGPQGGGAMSPDELMQQLVAQSFGQVPEKDSGDA